MDLGAVLSIIGLVVGVVAIVLLALVLRSLSRHRRELAELRAATTGAIPVVPADGEATDAGGEPTAQEDPPARLAKVAVVMNPVKFADADAFQRRVEEVVHRVEEAEVAFYETSREDPGQGQTRQALSDGADMVVAAGGDGTVRMVASVLAGTDVRMGIIPSGTGNLLARNVDVPLEDPAAAMTAALTGQDRHVDVGWLQTGSSIAEATTASPQIFLVIAGFGADAEMIGHTDDSMKKRIGWIAYVLGGVRTVMGRSVDVVLDLPDGTRHTHRARTVLLGNVGRLPGGFVLMPDATVDNGRLEIVVAGWRGAAGFSQVVTEVVNPRLVPSRRTRIANRLSTMERYLSPAVQVVTASPQPVQLDGDTDDEATHFIAKVDPGVLRLRVPVSTTGTSR